jgi:hypothetical protein
MVCRPRVEDGGDRTRSTESGKQQRGVPGGAPPTPTDDRGQDPDRQTRSLIAHGGDGSTTAGAIQPPRPGAPASAPEDLRLLRLELVLREHA